MAERSFKKEVEKLRLGAGENFEGEGILAVTKALLQAGVAYVGGYQGSPISHLMDVFADADPLLKELGVHFESSANEAAAGAMLLLAWKALICAEVMAGPPVPRKRRGRTRCGNRRSVRRGRVAGRETARGGTGCRRARARGHRVDVGSRSGSARPL